MFSVLERIAFEPDARISLNYDEKTCDRQSTCYQKGLKFRSWLREMFSSWVCLRLVENYDINAAVQLSAVFLTREHVDSGRVF